MAEQRQEQPETPPGWVGRAVIGDQSVQFYRNPVDFLERNIALHGPVFQTRILNTPTVVLACPRVVQEVFCGHENDEHEVLCTSAYKPISRSLFDRNLLFSAHSEANASVRQLLENAMGAQWQGHYLEIVRELSRQQLGSLHEAPVPIYSALKDFATEVCMHLFVDVDSAHGTDKDTLRQLLTEHWRGLVSAPVSISVNSLLGSYKSRNALAMEAKEKLLAIVRSQIERKREAPSERPQLSVIDVLAQSEHDAQELAEHLLLCVSALLPKAIASLLAWTVVELGHPHHVQFANVAREDTDMLDAVVHEVERLHPPFVCPARRVVVAEGGINANNFTIPQNHIVMICARTGANREFCPTKGARDPVFTFGHGAHKCVGAELTRQILRQVAHDLLQRYSWQIEEAPGEKWMPVNRVEPDVEVVFVQRTS